MPKLTRRHCLALLAAALPGAAVRAETVIGSGRMVSENRAVGVFEAVALEGAFSVKVRQGSREAVQVRADDNLLSLIESEVENRSGRPTLVLRWKRSTSVRDSGNIVISVEARTLHALSAAGSGTIDAEAIEGHRLALSVAGSGDLRVGRVSVGELQASVAGSGDIRAGGSAAAVRLSIAGSGDVDLAGVEAEQVKVSIAGSGDASVTAHQSLSVSIAGSGDLRYGGRVQTVKRSIVDSDEVQRR